MTPGSFEPAPIRAAWLTVASALAMCIAVTARAETAPSSLVVSRDAPGRAIAGRVYKVVFDFNSPSIEGSANRGLIALRSFGAEYQSYGVAPSHRRFVVVLSKSYVDIALTDEAYRARHDGRANPDAPVIKELMNQGVKFVVPVAEAIKAGVAQGDLQPGVDVGPTSDFLYINLESEGYVYTGTKSLEAQYP